MSTRPNQGAFSAVMSIAVSAVLATEIELRTKRTAKTKFLFDLKDSRNWPAEWGRYRPCGWIRGTDTMEYRNGDCSASLDLDPGRQDYRDRGPVFGDRRARVCAVLILSATTISQQQNI